MILVRNYDVYGLYQFKIIKGIKLNSGEWLYSVDETFDGCLADGFDGEFMERLTSRTVNDRTLYKLMLNEWIISMATVCPEMVPARLKRRAYV